MMKLMKYESRRLVRQLAPVWLMLAAGALVTRFLLETDSPWLRGAGKLALVATILLVFAGLLAVIACSWMNFYRFSFREEACMLHSLPVSDAAIWWSFVIPGALFLAASVAAGALAVWIIDPDAIMTLSLQAGRDLRLSAQALSLGVLVQFWIQFALYWLCGMTGMVLGLRMRTSRLGWSVLFGILLYVLFMALIVLTAFGMMGYDNIMNDTILAAPEVLKGLAAMMVLYGLTDLLLAAAGGWIHARGYDLE